MDDRFARKYRDPRWQRRRLEVLEAADFACENCGASDRELHVHHSFYRKGADPWDYEPPGLSAVCGPCHKGLDAIRKRLVELLCDCSPSTLTRILGYALAVQGDDVAGVPGFPQDAEEAEGIADFYRCSGETILHACDATYPEWADFFGKIADVARERRCKAVTSERELWARVATDGTNGARG